MTKNTTAVQPAQNQIPEKVKPKEFFHREDVKAKFAEIMGKRAAPFISSILQVTAQNSLLANADVNSIYQAAMMAAVLDLPINPNLGFAAIIPYNEKVKGKNGEPDSWRSVAQFQIMSKGFNQLAMRSGQFKTLNQTDVRDGEIISRDRLTGHIEFQWEQNDAKRDKLPIIGYVAFFELLNGFKKTFYMSVAETTAHGTRYSQTFKKGYGQWKDNFEAMSLKTVTKLLLSKYAPLSIEMQKGIGADQGIINDAQTEDISYSDVEPLQIEINKENERFSLMVDDCKTLDELKKLESYITNDVQADLYNQQLNALS
jgi:recombination protein RecT